MITIYHNGIIKGALDIPLAQATMIIKLLKRDIPGKWFLSATTTGKNAPTFVFGERRNIWLLWLIEKILSI